MDIFLGTPCMCIILISQRQFPLLESALVVRRKFNRTKVKIQ